MLILIKEEEALVSGQWGAGEGGIEVLATRQGSSHEVARDPCSTEWTGQ